MPISRVVRAIFPKSKFLRNVGILAGGTAFGQAIVVIASPFLTRMYSPDDFGVLWVYISIVSLVTVMASWRYEQAIPLPADDEDGANLLVLCLIIVVAMALATAIVVLPLGHLIVDLINAPQLKMYIWLVPIGVLGGGINGALSHWAIRKKSFGVLSKTKVSQGIGQVLTQIALGFARVGPFGLLLGDIVSRTAGSSTLSVQLWKQDAAVFRSVSLPDVRRVAHRYRRFPMLSGGAALLNSVGQNFPPLLIAAFFGTQVGGWIAIPQRVLGIPLTLVATSVARVYLGESASLGSGEIAAQKTLFRKTILSLTAVGACVVLLITASAHIVFPIVFGGEWAESADYVRVLAPSFLCQFVSSPIGGTLDVLERQDLHLLREVLRSILTIGALLFAGWASLTPLSAVLALSIATSVFYLIGIAIVWYAISDASKRQNLMASCT